MSERQSTRINDQIRISPVRVISQEGTQLGVMPTAEAMKVAGDSGLDLVEVAPEARPPVCRIMDYGKYKYQKGKKQSTGKKVHQTKTKEIRLRPKTGDHDIEFKVKRAKDFLSQKDKVLITMMFRGRENAHQEEGKRVVERVIEDLAEVGKVESGPSFQGRKIICTVAPR